MAEAFTELFPGSGGSKLDERSVPNTAAGGTAKRAVVVPGADDGRVQTFTTVGARIDANVADTTAIARLETLATKLDTLLAAIQATLTVSGTVTATGPLTDAQLRATAVPVSGTVTATGPLTDAQLRASDVKARDDYATQESLAEQTSVGSVLTFTFSAEVHHAIVCLIGTGAVGRVDVTGTPTSTRGLVAFDRQPLYVPCRTTVVKVSAPTGCVVNVVGLRR